MLKSTTTEETALRLLRRENCTCCPCSLQNCPAHFIEMGGRAWGFVSEHLKICFYKSYVKFQDLWNAHMGAVWVGSSGIWHLWLCALGQTISASAGKPGPWGTTRMRALCLLLKELDVKRGRQWNQGYSNNYVSCGKWEIQLCLHSLKGRL